MKKIFILSSIGILLINSACKKECKTYTQCEIEPIMLDYFGNYKPGNYWIYENQDSTKRDSVWVSDYKEVNLINLNSCIKNSNRTFLLHCQYWTPTKQFKGGIGGGCGLTEFSCTDSIKKVSWGFNNKIFTEKSITEINDFFVNGVGIRKFTTPDPNDTFTLKKYFIK